MLIKDVDRMPGCQQPRPKASPRLICKKQHISYYCMANCAACERSKLKLSSTSADNSIGQQPRVAAFENPYPEIPLIRHKYNCMVNVRTRPRDSHPHRELRTELQTLPAQGDDHVRREGCYQSWLSSQRSHMFCSLQNLVSSITPATPSLHCSLTG